jgi:thioredoxin 1
LPGRNGLPSPERDPTAAGSAAPVGAPLRTWFIFTFQPYQADVVEKAIKSGTPVVVHVYAPWCLQCHAQSSILSGLENDHTYDEISFFRVDYDRQKDVVAKLACPRSTVIAYRGGKEVARMSWGIMSEDVTKVLQAAL